jgi:hypothetical protein
MSRMNGFHGKIGEHTLAAIIRMSFNRPSNLYLGGSEDFEKIAESFNEQIVKCRVSGSLYAIQIITNDINGDASQELRIDFWNSAHPNYFVIKNMDRELWCDPFYLMKTPRGIICIWENDWAVVDHAGFVSVMTPREFHDRYEPAEGGTGKASHVGFDGPKSSWFPDGKIRPVSKVRDSEE